MIVYGMNVLKSIEPKKIKKVTTSRNEVIDYCKSNKIKYEYQDNHFLNKVTKENHQGVIIDIYDYDYYDISSIEGDFVLILDHLEDPHNFGAIIRTCECAGVNYIIIPKNRSVSVNSTVYKTSAGALSKVKIVEVTNLNNTISKLKSLGYWIYGADMNGKDYKTIDFSGKTCLVIGNEEHRLKKLVSDSCDEIVSIPMKGKLNSLNASVAAGILIFEIMKYK